MYSPMFAGHAKTNQTIAGGKTSEQSLTSEYDDEYSPLVSTSRRGSKNAEYDTPKPQNLLRVGTAVTVTIGLLLITIGAAMYKLGEEKAVVLGAHASLMATESDELCILEKMDEPECPIEKTRFFIPATADGRWPHQFSFVVLEGDRFLGATRPDRDVIYSENGKFSINDVPTGKKCKTFMSEVCLQGTHTLYPFSPTTAEETGYVMACDTFRVESGEALDLSISKAAECEDMEFENPAEKLLIKKYLPDLSIKEENTRQYMRLNNHVGEFFEQVCGITSYSKNIKKQLMTMTFNLFSLFFLSSFSLLPSFSSLLSLLSCIF